MSTSDTHPSDIHPSDIHLSGDHDDDSLHDALLAAHQAGDHATVDRLMRQQIAALVQLQGRAATAALPPLDASQLAGALALFPVWCVQRHFGIAWTDAQQQAWQRVSGLLVDSALAQPAVALRDGRAGPVSHDLAALLREDGGRWDEDQELDWAVRWWQQARAAGLPVEADFGEVWRGLEWLGLLHQLVRIGQACRQQHDSAAPAPAPGSPTTADVPRLVAGASKVALRYGPLKPLLRLLEPLAGPRVEAGFTF